MNASENSLAINKPGWFNLVFNLIIVPSCPNAVIIRCIPTRYSENRNKTTRLKGSDPGTGSLFSLLWLCSNGGMLKLRGWHMNYSHTLTQITLNHTYT